MGLFSHIKKQARVVAKTPAKKQADRFRGWQANKRGIQANSVGDRPISVDQADKRERQASSVGLFNTGEAGQFRGGLFK